MSLTEEIRELDATYVLPTYRRQPGAFVRGKGTRLYDAEGKEYLDFLAGIAVDALGHCHPAMVDAITKQANTLIHTSNHLCTEPQARLAMKICEITGMDRVFFCNCGTTATETALKIAKKHGHNKRPDGDYDIICLDRSFHGRTLGALTATGQEKYQKPFEPLIPGFRHIPANDIEALREAVTDRTAAVLIECIQGEGGLTTLTEEYVKEVRRLTEEHDALMIDDEVQAGIGRTGKWLAIQRFGVEPDVVCLAKALGGGFPIGACVTRGRTNTILAQGEHGSTFGGNALACATALAVLEEIERAELLQNAAERGAQLEAGLRQLPGVIEVRGAGLMVGAILDRPIARDVVRECLGKGLIINATDDNTLRFVPPLIISADEVESCLDSVKSCLTGL